MYKRKLYSIVLLRKSSPCVICQVALDINRTAKGNEWLELLKCSKGFETVLEFCDLVGESELSKYLSITYFICFFYLVCLILVLYTAHMCLHLGAVAGSRILCLGPFVGFSCVSDHSFVIERQACSLSTKPQVSTTLHYTITVCCNHTMQSQHCLPAIVMVQELNLKCARAMRKLNP